jgi:hypothetical protein
MNTLPLYQTIAGLINGARALRLFQPRKVRAGFDVVLRRMQSLGPDRTKQASVHEVGKTPDEGK